MELIYKWLEKRLFKRRYETTVRKNQMAAGIRKVEGTA